MPGFLTNEFYLYDPTDQSKQLKFDTSALTTGTLRTLIIPAFGTASETMATLGGLNTFTANNVFSATAPVTCRGGLGTNAASTGDTPLFVAQFSSGQVSDLATFTTSGAGALLRINYRGNFTDDSFAICEGPIDAGGGDSTKRVYFDVSGITTATDRTLTVQDANGTIALLSSRGDYVTVGNDPPAVAAGAMGKVDLTAQAAAIGSTNLTNGAAVGYYRVSYYLEDTTSDVTAGTIQFGIAYTDDIGATTQAGAALALTATGRDRGAFQVYLVSGELSYSTTLVGLIGAARYALHVRVEFLG
jgi:hypothetical protein